MELRDEQGHKVRRIGSPPLFFTCMLVILAIGYFNDHNSCVRSKDTRAGLRIYFEGQAEGVLSRASVEKGKQHKLDIDAYKRDIAAAESENPLKCGLPFPSTK